MSGWSSFKSEKAQFKNWRSFLNENKFYAAGLTSDVMEDSLVNFLKDLGELTDDEKKQIVATLFKYAEQENVLLEAIGDSGKPTKTFSAEATAALQNLLNSFDLEQSALNKVERAINQWANTNQIKFTSAPAPKPAAKPKRARKRRARRKPTPAATAPSETPPTTTSASPAAEKREPLRKAAFLRELDLLTYTNVKISEKVRPIVLNFVKEKIGDGEMYEPVKISMRELAIELAKTQGKVDGLPGKKEDAVKQTRAVSDLLKGITFRGKTTLGGSEESFPKFIKLVDGEDKEVDTWKDQVFPEDVEDHPKTGLQKRIRRQLGKKARDAEARGNTRAFQDARAAEREGEPKKAKKKKPRVKDLIAKIKKAKTLEDLEALVPDDEKRTTVLRARDARRGEIKKAEKGEAPRKKIKVTPKTKAVVVVAPKKDPKVYLSKPGPEKAQKVKQIAAKPVVDPSDKEELSQSAFDYTPSEKEDAAEQRRINREISQTVEPENISITTDGSAVKKIQDVTPDSVFTLDIQELIGAYLETSEPVRQDRSKINVMITKFLGAVDTGPVRNILRSLDIKPKEEDPVSGLAAMLASMKTGLAALDEPPTGPGEEEEEVPALEPALKETKTVKDYINESYEDKFNKLLKAFVK